MTMRQSFQVTDSTAENLKPYVKAMMTASGLNEFDAACCVLFAITTHLDLDQYPILVFLGARGTGKSAAMKQLFDMCKDSKWIQGTTLATQRNALDKVRTAFLDEADIVDSKADLTDLYTKRYLRETGTVEANVRRPYGIWETQPYDIFGATIMAKRTPIGDVALRSRSIIIHTAYRLENYEYKEIKDVSNIASSIASKVRKTLSIIGGVDRVYQTWSSLEAIAKEFDMRDWLNQAIEIEVQETEALAGGQGYEPSDAILQAIDIASRDEVTHERIDKSVKISDIVRIVREEFSLTLRANQIKDEANSRGFEIGTLHGYPVIKVKKDHFDTLLPEEG